MTKAARDSGDIPPCRIPVYVVHLGLPRNQGIPRTRRATDRSPLRSKCEENVAHEARGRCFVVSRLPCQSPLTRGRTYSIEAAWILSGRNRDAIGASRGPPDAAYFLRPGGLCQAGVPNQSCISFSKGATISGGSGSGPRSPVSVSQTSRAARKRTRAP
jgi:hypothetical protein